MGTVSYAGWAASHGFDSDQWAEFEKADWRRFADEAIYRSGVTGIFSEVQGALSDINATRDLVQFSAQGAARNRDPDLLATVAGVSASTAQKIATVLGGIDDPTQQTTAAMRKLTFYNNVWYLRRLFEGLETGAAEAVGLPEQRD
jgi:hypothetical protein